MAGKEKVSLSLDRDLIAEVRRRVGKRELSSYLNEALERRLQADAVVRYFDQTDLAAGPVPTDVAAGVDDAYARRFERTRNAKQRRRVSSTAV
jgi:crotonobetainyl-CoA:carnitine CoA-transferase CaiB-like acyl-CoA transferase